MDEDTVPPLVNLEGENVAIASGSSTQRPPLRLRRSSTSPASAQLQQMHSNSGLRRTRSRQFSQSSMDSFLPPRIPEARDLDEPKEPSPFRFGLLLLVALPILAGLLFENGGTFMVDLLLVVIGCLLLYWSIEYPWEWYDSARILASVEDNPALVSDSAILEESSEDEKGEGDAKSSKEEGKTAPKGQDQAREMRREGAARALNAHELVALLFCFISPPIAAYTLHRIRHYLARPQSSPVENAPLTIFVLGAEILPIRRVAEMVLARTMHLQKIVTSYDTLQTAKRREARALLTTSLEGMAKRLEALEATGIPSVQGSTEIKVPDEQFRLNIQNQLDALNRAVRRYEKRALTQSIMVEGRLKDLEGRINDALTLAAAASRRSQTSGVVVYALNSAASLFLLPLSAARSLLSWPVDMCADFYRFLFGPRRKKKKPRTKAEEAKISRTKLDGL